MNTGAGPSPVAQSRKRRWDELNKVLDANRESKRQEDNEPTVGHSYVKWRQIAGFFPVVVGPVVGDSHSGTVLPDELLTALHMYLSYASICFFGMFIEGNESTRVHFIAPIIMIVCSFFKGRIKILAEEQIEGNRVHAHGHFEFVLKRGTKRICIVEAKKDDILQGRTQCLVGCESLCDVEDLAVTYGIATNYLEWCFLKNEADQITEELLTISLHNGKPTAGSLRVIANKIISILE